MLLLNGCVGKLVTPGDCKSPVLRHCWFDSNRIHQNLVCSYRGYYCGLSIRLRGFDSPTDRQIIIAGRVRSPAWSHKPLPSLVQIQAPQPFASETWKSERSYKPFSARLAFLRGFDSLRWYHFMYPWCNGSIAVSKTVRRSSSLWGYAKFISKGLRSRWTRKRDQSMPEA